MESEFRNITIGIFANVDAGKTTLSEGIFALAGNSVYISQKSKDGIFDFYNLEKERGMTIFAKEGTFCWKGFTLTLIDTPGHREFLGEVESAIGILDFAILVINGAEDLECHTVQIYQLLKSCVPTIIFVNKMDITHKSKNEILSSLTENLNQNIFDIEAICLNKRENCEKISHIYEDLAVMDEELLNEYLEHGAISRENLALSLIRKRISPVVWGVATQKKGIVELLDMVIDTISVNEVSEISSEFSAKVYRISRDKKGERFAHIKILSGTLRLKDSVSYVSRGNENHIERAKVNKIRIYFGEGYQEINEAKAGDICAVQGLEAVYAGQYIGGIKKEQSTVYSTYMEYRVVPNNPEDMLRLRRAMEEIFEEAPYLKVEGLHTEGGIRLNISGDLLLEVLRYMLKERFSLEVKFEEAPIEYRETILNCSKGIGVNQGKKSIVLILELMPGEYGWKIEISRDFVKGKLKDSDIKNILDIAKNNGCRGLLLGKAIDHVSIKITGVDIYKDFENIIPEDIEAAFSMAMNSAMLAAEKALLEPVYEIELECKDELCGKLIADISQMGGVLNLQEIKGYRAILRGQVAEAGYRDYVRKLKNDNGDNVDISIIGKKYDICHNQQEVLKNFEVDSVFLEDEYLSSMEEIEKLYSDNFRADEFNEKYDEEDLKAIFERTYRSSGKNKKFKVAKKVIEGKPDDTYIKKKLKIKKGKITFVDGYNIIFAWEELKELANSALDAARQALIEKMANYSAYSGEKITLVFDAYNVKSASETYENISGIDIIYTKENQTADQYIERNVNLLSKEYDVVVASSDSLVQMVSYGDGAMYLSAEKFRKHIEAVEAEISARIKTEATTVNSIRR